ncbi:FAD-binding protein [Methylobacterium sp. V23]|uniref:FAD-binding protein n=1 Tax=Methylobacterium sp. V23 TaxID=2044878 RepID=UPI000CDB71F9|nr:FAD-binding protein [Methylobacterium sp. V23]POR39949.1 hypothetical protein CRT23_26615 [Methylobacterium sp. V23]
MMEDPVLAAHAVAGPCFEIGGEFTPGSIRDQMVRACLIVQRAADKSLISARRPLLVIGAGPTGMTAALHAAKRGIPVEVVDTAPSQTFALFRCDSRDVEPTLYDWPAAHWDRAEFPWAGAAMPLPWQSAKADEVARKWALEMNRSLKGVEDAGSPAPKFHWSACADFGDDGFAPNVDDEYRVWVTLQRIMKDGSKVPIGSNTPFGAVLACAGRDVEDCCVKTYTGFSFWESDRFEDPDCGCASAPRVLISGGGDGALQDFIRIMTGLGTGKFFDGLLLATDSHLELFETVFAEIGQAEDVAQRAMSWNEPRKRDDAVLLRLDRAHTDAIAKLKASAACWADITAYINAVVAPRAPNVQLLHSRAFFTECYALNRFLALLLIEVLGADKHRIPNARVSEVRCLHDPHGNGAAGCHGLPHEVSFRKSGEARDRTETFQVVVIRHGVGKSNRIFKGETAVVRRRQILPYFIEP